MNALLSALGTMVLIGGLCVAAVLWCMPAPVQQDRPDSPLQVRLKALAAKFDRTTWMIMGGAAAVGLVIGLLTGALLYLLLLPAAVIVGRLVLSAQGHAKHTEQLQQMEAWTRSLSGMIVTGAALETALMGSLSNAGTLIRPQIEHLASRIQAGWSTMHALEVLAEEWADPTGDMIVLHLKLAAKQRGAGLARALDDLSEGVSEEVKIRRKVASDRAAPTRQARIVSIATLGLLCVIPLLGGPMATYREPIGQLLYAALATITLWLLWMMRQSVAPQAQPRMMQKAVQS
ncbi:type II secretion system F family protein [Micrococcus luteus]|uniref:type II secretion system F family protein n=1 Tax=Micrococcus luteus TaxID=1270 RepID=UPI002302F0A2|nr:type II secretion system F family protein [Micrococcus luteus]